MPRPSKNERSFRPGLKEYWQSYGHSVPWEDLIDFKERSDGYYIVFAWDHGDGTYGIADIAGSADHWEMQNDSEELTVDQWKKLYIVPECDWYRIKGEE